MLDKGAIILEKYRVSFGTVFRVRERLFGQLGCVLSTYYVEDTRNDVTQSNIESVLLACSSGMSNQLAL